MMHCIKDYPITNTSVLLRCDLNVPLKDGLILDNYRIKSSLNTIKYLISCGAKVIIISHLGRPNGEINPKYSLEPVCKELSKILDIEIKFIKNITSNDSINYVSSLPSNSIVMLENLRFHKEEEMGDESFAQILSQYATCFVNDAFSCSHRKHSSIYTITKFLPSFSGLNLENEIKQIDLILQNNNKMFCIIGGGKVSSKIGLIKKLIPKSSAISLNGGMANTFLLAKKFETGLSLVEKDKVKDALEIIDLCTKHSCKLILPVDVVVSKSFEKPINTRVIDINSITIDDFIMDVGIKTMQEIEMELQNSENIIWNGPLGVYENKPFDIGSLYLARLIAYYTRLNKIKSIIGGGDAVACANLSGLFNEFSFISTAGGAFLEYLENSSLPAIESLKYKLEK